MGNRQARDLVVDGRTFSLQKEIAAGGFAHVYSATEKGQGAQAATFAIKHIIIQSDAALKELQVCGSQWWTYFQVT